MWEINSGRFHQRQSISLANQSQTSESQHHTSLHSTSLLIASEPSIWRSTGTSSSQEHRPLPPRSPVRDTASDADSPSGATIKEKLNSSDHESDDTKPSTETMPQQLSNDRVPPSKHHRAYDDAMRHLKHSLDRAIQALSSTHHDFRNETQGMSWYITPSQLQELWLTRLDHEISTPDPLYRPGRFEWAVGECRYATNLLSRSLFMASMCTIESMGEEQRANYPGNLEKEWREWREWRNMAQATMRQLKSMLAGWDRVEELLRKLRKMRGRLERWGVCEEDEGVEGGEWYFPFSGVTQHPSWEEMGG